MVNSAELVRNHVLVCIRCAYEERQGWVFECARGKAARCSDWKPTTNRNYSAISAGEVNFRQRKWPSSYDWPTTNHSVSLGWFPCLHGGNSAERCRVNILLVFPALQYRELCPHVHHGEPSVEGGRRWFRHTVELLGSGICTKDRKVLWPGR